MAKTKIEQTNPIMPNKIQKGQFDQFFKLIQQRIDHYESNKGFFRRHFSAFKHSDYMDDLIKVNNRLQSKLVPGQDLTLNDMRWFYEACYGASAKYSSPSMWSSTSLSASVFRTISSALKNVYPNGLDEFIAINDKAQTTAREYVKNTIGTYQENENIYTFEGRNPGFKDAFNKELSETILWPPERATSPSLAPPTGTGPALGT